VILAFIFQSTPNQYLSVLPMILILGIFYFLVFRPMQRVRKAKLEMLAGLKPGSTVQTTGGMIGTIISISGEDDTLVLRVRPDNVRIQIALDAVAGVISDKS
jgi:preprotein translocase subunit YajC